VPKPAAEPVGPAVGLAGGEGAEGSAVLVGGGCLVVAGGGEAAEKLDPFADWLAGCRARALRRSS